MPTVLLARAHRESREEEVRRYPAVSKDASKLAAAVAVLLKAAESGAEISLESIWEAIEKVVSRSELKAAVANIIEVVPAPDADQDAEWRATLIQRYPTVRRFLPQLCATIEFGATPEALPVLDALRALPRLMEARATKAVPTGYFDVGRVVLNVVPPSWRSVVFKPGRPGGTGDRAGYGLCVIDKF